MNSVEPGRKVGKIGKTRGWETTRLFGPVAVASTLTLGGGGVDRLDVFRTGGGRWCCVGV